ncbi:hypothetical protein Acsp01_86920 [Actinoplanes sp. NBRC 101535]|nr:hypothetical protein Acsp01_86920 [Actinoplanes sp. NBRC 101535]
MTGVYLTVDDAFFLRAVQDGRVYLSEGGLVMQRGLRHGGQNKRAGRAHRKAVNAGWVVGEPEPGSRLFRLTPGGEAALAARDATGAAPVEGSARVA